MHCFGLFGVSIGSICLEKDWKQIILYKECFIIFHILLDQIIIVVFWIDVKRLIWKRFLDFYYIFGKRKTQQKYILIPNFLLWLQGVLNTVHVFEQGIINKISQQKKMHTLGFLQFWCPNLNVKLREKKRDYFMKFWLLKNFRFSLRTP